jgi:hypothetical protein
MPSFGRDAVQRLEPQTVDPEALGRHQIAAGPRKPQMTAWTGTHRRTVRAATLISPRTTDAASACCLTRVVILGGIEVDPEA